MAAKVQSIPSAVVPSPSAQLNDQVPSTKLKPSTPQVRSTHIASITPRPRREQRISESQSRVQTLFDYVPKSVESNTLFNQTINSTASTSHAGVDALFYNLGLKYSHGIILGSNRRCIALLQTLIEYIKSYATLEGRDFRHDFATKLKTNLKFLKECRPFAVSMENAIEYFNSKCHGLSENLEQSEGIIKSEWIDALNEYLEGIIKAKEAIVEKSMDKIKQGDTILVYGYSEVISDILIAVSKQKIKISLVVVGDRSLSQERKGKGLEIISNQSDLDTEYISSLTYTSVTGMSNLLQSVTKVFLGAHALLTNGSVLAHVGTSQIALMASAHNIPVLVCCETYKFCDKCPTDSFFHNELGFGFGRIQSLKPKWEDSIGLITPTDEDEIEKLLQTKILLTPVIKYDLTPPELVTAVITDVDILPCMSVPVVLRVQENRHLASLRKT